MKLRASTPLFIFALLSSSLTQAQTPIVQMQIEGETLEFFQDHAEVLKKMALPQSPITLKSPELNCPTHQALAAAVIERSARCERVSSLLLKLQKTSSVCLETRNPIEYLRRLPLKEVVPTDMNEMETILTTIAPALNKTGLMESWKTQGFFDLTTSILVKLRADLLREKMEEQRQLLKSLSKSSNDFQSCAKNESLSETWAGSLMNESLDLKKQIENLETAGLAQAQKERQQVQARGLVREDLPYPTLTDSERRFLTAALGGILWRARGGGIFLRPLGTNQKRTAFTWYPNSLLAQISGGKRAESVGLSLFQGLLAPWGRFHDMGRMDGEKHSDYVSMVDRGRYQVKAVVSQLKSAGYNTKPLEKAGEMMGHCYWYSWEKLTWVQLGMKLGTEGPIVPFSGGNVNWGEWCTGTAIGIGISETLLMGHR